MSQNPQDLDSGEYLKTFFFPRIFFERIIRHSRNVESQNSDKKSTVMTNKSGSHNGLAAARTPKCQNRNLKQAGHFTMTRGSSPRFPVVFVKQDKIPNI